LLEAELFGDEPAGQRRGLLRAAAGGTLVLKHIEGLPRTVQLRLLNFLQERPGAGDPGSGDNGHEGLDVRIISTTTMSVTRLMKSGRLAAELLQRLSDVRIELPPLREHPEDIPVLAAYFVSRYTRPGERRKEIAPAVMDRLLRHEWPGNVRELEVALERACLTASGPNIEPEDLSLKPLPRRSALISRAVDLNRPLPELVRDLTEEVEKKYLFGALQKTRGNIGRCARLCGLSRRSISAKLAQYHIDKRRFKRADD
jgi:DNA-binding NtrC family response regulator